MANSASSKRRGNAAPGIPIKPGEVRNPEGRNQWTYRRDFELAVARLLKSDLT